MKTIINAINSLSMELTGETFSTRELATGIAKGVCIMYALWAMLYFVANILPTLY